MNPFAIFFFGFLSGFAVMLVIFQVCLGSLKRTIRRLIERDLDELKAEARRRLDKP